MRRSCCHFLFALLFLGASTAGAVHHIYVDSANAQAGNGSESNPYNRLSLINWTSVATNVAVGTPVTINLKRGSTFRETLNVGASGSSNAPIIIKDYGEGDLPIIRGDTVLTGWTPQPSGAGQTWSTPWSAPVFYVWIDGVRALKGQNADALSDKEWFSSGGRLYFRSDAGDPDHIGLVVSTAARGNAVLISARRHVQFEQICFRNSSSYLVRILNSEAIDLRRCQLLQAGGQLELNSVVNIRAMGCTLEDAFGLPMVTVAGANTTADLFFCHLHNAASGDAVFVSACQAVNLVNCNIIGVRARAVDNISGGLINIRNCLFSGTAIGRDSSGNETISSTTGICQVATSLVLPNGQNPALHMKGVTDLGGNVYREPRFQRTRREGLWVNMEDDYPTLGDWSVLARMAKSNYGYRTSLALNNTDRIHPEFRLLLQELVFEGHDLVSHTRSHANVAAPGAFLIQYVGSAPGCTMTISNNWLLTTVDDVDTNDNLRLNLFADPVDRLEKLIPYIDRLPAYTCAYISVPVSYNHAVPTILLQEVDGVDIKSTYSAVFDKARFYTNEIWRSRSDLEANFIDISGAPYECKYLIYPGGYVNDDAINSAIDAGYLGGRIASPVGYSWQMDKFDMFLAQIGVGMNGSMLTLPFENNVIDYSPARNNFTTANVQFSTKAHHIAFSAKFNGTNAFLWRFTNPHFDFSRGDWHLSARLWPDTLSENRAVYSMWSDSSNYFKVFADNHAALNVLVVSNGVEVLSLATPSGTLHTNGWQKISIQQLFDRWMVRINDALVVDTTNTARLLPYTGPVLIGSSYDFSSDTNGEFYSGLMDTFVMSNGTYYKTHAAADLMCEVGGFVNAMSHGETGTPREVWRIVFDALKDYSGRLNVTTYTEASDYIRSNGVLLADRRTVVRTNGWGLADYNLRLDSPCVRAAANDPVQGLAHLFDANGIPVTDANGQIIVAGGRLSIGALQPRLQIISTQLPPAMVGGGYSAALAAEGGVGAYQWGLASGSSLPAGLMLSSAGVLSGQPTVSGLFTFTLEVTDGAGQTAQQTISLQIAAPPAFHIESFTFYPSNSSTQLRVRVEAPVILTLESSTNLQDWTTATTLTVTNGSAVWESFTTDSLQRFYRLRF
jgi:hypothetical protein